MEDSVWDTICVLTVSQASTAALSTEMGTNKFGEVNLKAS